MPNWCENHLEITGEEYERDRFIRQAEGDAKLVFDNLVPMPKTKENTEGDGWYDWRVRNWGTKWDATEVVRTISNDLASYSFITAWSPPVEWLNVVSTKYPALRFSLTYWEPGNGLRGTVEFIDGKILSSTKGSPESFEKR